MAINQSKMLRYADRRRKKEELNKFEKKQFQKFGSIRKMLPIYRMINKSEIEVKTINEFYCIH